MCLTDTIFGYPEMEMHLTDTIFGHPEIEMYLTDVPHDLEKERYP